MKKLKVLNLYAGIGGNRKLWEDVEVVAVEIKQDIAKVYQDFFPDDKVIVYDAHKYLLEHFNEFDFIWSSPPCQTHSLMRKNVSVPRGQVSAVYPDMRLYQEIIFLRHHVTCKWVVENVKGYYNPLIRPQESGGHYFWSNFNITKRKHISRGIEFKTTKDLKKISSFNLDNYKFKRKDQIYHNCVNINLGLHVFNCAFKIKQSELLKT